VTTGAVSGLPSMGVVVLTRGNRPAELNRALTSALDQRGLSVDVVCIGNGWQPQELPDRVHSVHLPENIGVGGRNAGVPAVKGDILFFLDDDAWFPDPDVLADVARIFAEHPLIGMVQTRLADPASPAPRYWIPRLRKGDARRSSTSMYVLEAAVAVRRAVFEQVGGWPERFQYAHEGIDLTWRVWDAGYMVWYAGDPVTFHPAIQPTRHSEYQELNGRNRVWLARRNLPVPVAAAYLAVWTPIEWWRARRTPGAWQAWRRGAQRGWAEDPGSRSPMSWSTVWRMTTHGRPPII
jgi:GT2 family glycosyltransferase